MGEPLSTMPADAPPPAVDWDRLTAGPSGPDGPAPLPATAFTIGRFLSATFSTWTRNLVPFTLLGLLTAIPTAVYAWFALRSLQAPRFDPAHPFATALETLWRTYSVIGVGLLGSSLGQAALAQGAVAHLRGAPVRFGNMLAAGVRRFLPTLVLELLATAVFLGTACTIVVPILLGAGWCAAVPAVVVEGRGPFAAMKRSWELTRGLRSVVFVGFLVLMLIVWAVVLPASILARAAAVGVSYGAALAAGQVVSHLVSGCLAALVGAGLGTSYHLLRVASEGPESAVLAQVFE